MADTRWLSEDELQTWRAFLIATRLLWSRLERDIQHDAKMPLTYYEILSTLSAEPQCALRMRVLAEILQVSPSRISHAVDRMEQWGWVRREPCSSDRRGWIAVLTDAGYAVLERAAPSHVESVRTHLFDQLTSAQLDQLREISDALLRHLSPKLSEAHAALSESSVVSDDSMTR